MKTKAEYTLTAQLFFRAQPLSIGYAFENGFQQNSCLIYIKN